MTTSDVGEHIKIQLTGMIEKGASNPQYNAFYALGKADEPMWNKPVVGFASGADEYFRFWKTHIGAFHLSPAEAFSLKYKDESVMDESLTVISMAFPQTVATKLDQSRSQITPSLRWSASRGEWRRYIQGVNENVIRELENIGIRAVSIDLLPEIGRRVSDNYGLASNWSHRHAAFVCGLGTFGLSDGLITRAGKAVRFSTVIVDRKIKPDIRPYERYNEWCLFYAGKGCGRCIGRCPVKAISVDGHDKKTCDLYLQQLVKNVPTEIKSEDKSDYYGCGLCQTGIPCQDGIPEDLLK